MLISSFVSIEREEQQPVSGCCQKGWGAVGDGELNPVHPNVKSCEVPTCSLIHCQASIIYVNTSR